tara:strand:- start:1161 stop:1763 length:603 start_codon:yes stop_codon:yes gene_type:complete
MGRKAKFKIGNDVLESEFFKVDRSKIYGFSKKHIMDTKKNECQLSDLYEGTHILPRGSIAQVLIDKNGNSVSRSELVGFNSKNERVEKVSSIFSIENQCKEVSIDNFLSFSIKSVYQLNIEAPSLSDWGKYFSKQNIYKFIFNYREDYEGDDAFLLSNEQGYFIAVGNETKYDYLQLENVEVDDIKEDQEIDDDLDFSMF